MGFRENDTDTRKFTPKFTVDEWVSFRERLKALVKSENLSERNEKILTELIVNMRTTEELAYLARTDNDYEWLQSNQRRPMSGRRIKQILDHYFPEFKIQTTHKKNNPRTKIRNEQTVLKQVIITKDSECAWCGSKESLELHHLLPVCIGGDNDSRNLMILCHDCHQEATKYFMSLLRQGKIMRNEKVSPN